MNLPTLDPQHRLTPHRSKQHASITRGAGAGAVLTLFLVLIVLAPGAAGARLAAEPAAGETDAAAAASSGALATPETLPAPLPALAPAAPTAPAALPTPAAPADPTAADTGGGPGLASPAASAAGSAARPGSGPAGAATTAGQGNAAGSSGAPGAAAGAATATAAAPVADGGAPPAPPAAIADGADPEALTRAYRRTGNAALIQVGDRGAAILIPFGHGRPVLRCAPLRACAFELEPGELVLATSLGDGERWLVQSAAAGPGARTPLLVVKPTACDLSTNLVVATDRRIYELALDSPPCRGADAGESGAYNPHLPYTGLVRFYYPDDLVRRWTDQERLARQQAAELAAGRTPLAAAARLPQLNFDYAWDRSRRWPWVPSQVFDDGEHTYLILPPAARLAELPILLGVEPGGGLALLTYHLEGNTLVADRVLERAVLVVGHGKPRDEQRLEIANHGFASRGGRRGGS